jgi:hypothetical protein
MLLAGLKLDDPDRACLCAKGFCAINGKVRTLLGGHTQVNEVYERAFVQRRGTRMYGWLPCRCHSSEEN